jgi:hypothetical protein
MRTSSIREAGAFGSHAAIVKLSSQAIANAVRDIAVRGAPELSEKAQSQKASGE